ncbi:MAG: DNA polymerase Y family protein [Actinomycetota bacterium]
MAPVTSTERITVVSCRAWPVIGCGRRLDDLAIVVAGNRVVASSAAAEQLGVTVGLRRREAQRRAPGVEVLAPDPAGEARAFAGVLRALDDITPRIEIDRPGWCSFLTRGPSRYFGGDRAMSDRVASVVAEALEGRTTVHVGTADSRFAAVRVARMAEADRGRVVAAGASRAFLAPLPVQTLVAGGAAPGASGDQIAQWRELDEMVDVLQRLGLDTLGAFAELTINDVTARFGAVGIRAHGWAQGHDDRMPAPEDPPADLEASIELDPPVERVDHAAFLARTLADEFIRKLRSRGISCARIAIAAESEHGEEQVRLWRSDEAFSAAAIADRMRWQLDGWLSGPVRLRPTGGLRRLALRPDDLRVAAGRQLGFWGEQTGLAERAARSVARVQGLVGTGVVVVPELRGGRSPGDVVTPIPAESVDLVERASAVDRTVIGGSSVDPTAGVAGEGAGLPWAGALPAPAPAVVHEPPLTAQLTTADGQGVTITSRGLVEGEPAFLQVHDRPPLPVVAWSGPWLLDERWWHEDRKKRSARMQIVLEDGRAVLAATQAGTWSIVASYD